ncbi:MAG: 50S ribosomal protein L30 [Chitinophagales bacterium]
MAKIKVTKTGSTIKTTARVKDTMRALGLNKMGSTNVLDKTPSVEGMINKVKHLVSVENAG